MTAKNKALEFSENSKGLVKNKKLCATEYNTPVRIGQFQFNSVTTIHTRPGVNGSGLSRCYKCLRWTDDPGGGSLWLRPGLASVFYHICRPCGASLNTLPPNLKRGFFEACERNLLRALEGGQG